MIQLAELGFSNLNLLEWFLLVIFGIVLIFRFVRLFYFDFRALFRWRRNDVVNQQPREPISVFTTIRNEEENLRRALPPLLDINFSDYQVVVVDDYSQDNSYSVLGVFQRQYSHLKKSTLNEETRFSTKIAQNIALKSADYSWVLQFPVFADGFSRAWLGRFLEGTTSKERNLLLAYCGVEPRKGFFNKLYRCEMHQRQIKSAGYIAAGVPFVYSEYNLAFRKELYFEMGGYGSKLKEHNANLELIVNSFIRKQSTALLFDDDSKILLKVEGTKESFFDLLRQGLAVERYLSSWKRFVLYFDEFTTALFVPVSVVNVAFCQLCRPLVLMVVTLFLLCKLFLVQKTLRGLNERKIFISSLVYDLLIPYFKVGYRWYESRKWRQKWKNRV